ncbi:hypothetical protein Tco_0270220 [Tanacetum coccineum]
MSSSNSRRNGTFGFQNLSSELDRQGLEMDYFLHFQIEDATTLSGWILLLDRQHLQVLFLDRQHLQVILRELQHVQVSLRDLSAQNLGKAECSNCKFLAEKIKTLEARIMILEGQLEMERHPENHTLESATILHEIYNGMGNLNME